MTGEPTRVAFVCVRNAGRSQIAHALAERQLAARGLEERVELRSGGTRPAAAVHDVVVEAMREVGVDLADRQPRELTPEERREADVVVTMGCSAEEACPAGWDGEHREWDLPDPHGRSLEAVRELRAEIDRRVEGLFDELAGRG